MVQAAVSSAGQREAWEPDESARGLECRYCRCRHFRVVYTRPTWTGRDHAKAGLQALWQADDDLGAAWGIKAGRGEQHGLG